MGEATAGKCMDCGKEIAPNSYGYCLPCATEYHRKRDEEFPYVVHFGNDNEEFATEKEAQDFCDELHRAYVDKKQHGR